jgi:hypothetical protein
VLGVSRCLRAKGNLKQPPLAGTQDSRHLRTLVGITNRVLHEVKDARGLQVKVWTGGRNESFESCESKDHKMEAT